MAFMICLVGSTMAWAQNSDPMSVLKKEAGVWDCEVRFYPDPNGQPTLSKAVETNTMVGDVWMVSDFKGEMAGAAFHGSSQMGYDPQKKKYIGSWIDSAGPYPTAMEGTYDSAKKTLTIVGIGKDPTGTEMKMKLVTVYKEKDTRTMSMFIESPSGEWMRMMEVDYQRKK
jgi:hypothetical protein